MPALHTAHMVPCKVSLPHTRHLVPFIVYASSYYATSFFHLIKSGIRTFYHLLYFNLGIKGIRIILIFLYEYHSQLCRNFSYKVS